MLLPLSAFNLSMYNPGETWSNTICLVKEWSFEVNEPLLISLAVMSLTSKPTVSFADKVAPMIVNMPALGLG